MHAVRASVAIQMCALLHLPASLGRSLLKTELKVHLAT